MLLLKERNNLISKAFNWGRWGRISKIESVIIDVYLETTDCSMNDICCECNGWNRFNYSGSIIFVLLKFITWNECPSTYSMGLHDVLSWIWQASGLMVLCSKWQHGEWCVHLVAWISSLVSIHRIQFLECMCLILHCVLVFCIQAVMYLW
jgi:hypothetical protein